MLNSLLIPVSVVMTLFVLAAVRAVLRRARERRQPPGPLSEPRKRGLGATGTEELQALFYPGKRIELEQRRIELVLRDDEHDGAPPNRGIDLDGGTATIRLPEDPEH